MNFINNVSILIYSALIIIRQYYTWQTSTIIGTILSTRHHNHLLPSSLLCHMAYACEQYTQGLLADSADTLHLLNRRITY